MQSKTIKIKSRWGNTVLHTVETDNLKEAILFLTRQRADLSGANLYGANLHGADLSGANLSRADLSMTALSMTALSGANLSGANLSGADLYGANLSRADLSGANLYGANLHGAALSGADLSGANLSGANLSGADLYGANLHGADLSMTALSGADLSGANLSEANLYGANLHGADLSGADIGDLICISELSDAISIAPLIWDEWQKNGIDSAQKRFGLYRVRNEYKALTAIWPMLHGGFCFILERREIWAWNWTCPNPKTVPVLWREAHHKEE